MGGAAEGEELGLGVGASVGYWEGADCVCLALKGRVWALRGDGPPQPEAGCPSNQGMDGMLWEAKKATAESPAQGPRTPAWFKELAGGKGEAAGNWRRDAGSCSNY